MTKKPPYNENAAIRGAIRRTFSRSPIIREVLQKVRREVPRYRKDGSRAKKDAVQFLCATCKQYVGSTCVSVDHIDPVIPTEGFTDWNTFVKRLFCGADNLAPICDECHQKKTNEERRARQRIKDLETLEELKRKDVSGGRLTDKELKLFRRLTKKLGS